MKNRSITLKQALDIYNECILNVDTVNQKQKEVEMKAFCIAFLGLPSFIDESHQNELMDESHKIQKIFRVRNKSGSNYSIEMAEYHQKYIQLQQDLKDNPYSLDEEDELLIKMKQNENRTHIKNIEEINQKYYEFYESDMIKYEDNQQI